MSVVPRVWFVIAMCPRCLLFSHTTWMHQWSERSTWMPAYATIYGEMLWLCCQFEAYCNPDCFRKDDKPTSNNKETINASVSRTCCRILCCTIKPEWINRSCRVLKTGVRPIGNHRNDYVARLKKWKTNVTVAYFIPSWSTIGYDWLRYLIVIYNKIIIPFHHLLFNSLLAWSDFTASVHVQLHVTRKQPWMSYRQYTIQGCFLLYFLTLHSHTVHEYIAHVDLLVTGN